MTGKDYDSQLLESVSVRRRRMRDALLYGPERARRTADERLGKLFAGIAVAAVMCAGCVGWSFIQDKLADQKAERSRTGVSSAVVPPSRGLPGLPGLPDQMGSSPRSPEAPPGARDSAAASIGFPPGS
ncbi:hypothetical protein [Streptomyces zingiberis]|uniref:hypothetical protein n=1 Tax=Streptomyces zingiberis TaxID=2053010 RepID=UPI001F0E2287|nr:hypothetical protein [Streptomyces zingiberis]